MSEPIVIKTPFEMQKQAREFARTAKTVGFVPTMGALHAGHKALLQRARRDNDIVVASIYVNPTQFGEGEDFDKYPRTFDADKKLCAESGVDFIFAPETLYGSETRAWVEVGQLGNVLCGISRPGHFRGVATVVAKLLNIVRPERAYFGRKDAQQLVVIETIVRDLNLGCDIIACETVRESDGLAMSSRNRYLSPAERKAALAIPRSLQHCRARIENGERDAMKLLGEMGEILTAEPGLELDYAAIVDANNLEDLKQIQGEVLVAVAAKSGATRLIDNAVFDLP